MKPRRFYVYILDDWIGIPRWVGAGRGKRWNVTRYQDNANTAKNAFLAETRTKIGRVPIRIIKDDLSQEEAWELERRLIKEIGRTPNGPLLNLAEGGPGPVGHKRSEEQKEKHSKAMKGRKLSPEHRAAIAASGIGRQQSVTTRAKRSATMTGRQLSNEHLANIRAAAAKRPSRKGIPLSDSVRANQSSGAKARWARDKTPRAQRGADGRFFDPENPAAPIGLGTIECPGCGRSMPHHAKGLCDTCYNRENAKVITKRRVAEKASQTRPQKPRLMPRPCAAPGCEKTTTKQSKLYCNTHYRQSLASGQKTIVTPTEEQKTVIISSYEAGQSTYKIGGHVGMQPDKVQYWLKKWSVVLRPAGFKRLYAPVVPHES